MTAAPHPRHRLPTRRLLIALFAALLVLPAVLAASNAAAAPSLLFQIPSNPTPGSGAGQLDNPRDIAANPETGHIYVSESVNSRISEFTAWGSFVRAWGWDVAPDGAPGDTPADQFEICTTTCQAGAQGTGAGQFSFGLKGISVDSQGAVYAVDSPIAADNTRVQKFDVNGNFVLMFGGEVNKGPTNPGDICTAQHISEGDTCGAGIEGTPDGWFSPFNDAGGNYIAYNPTTDTIFVGDRDRIQEFNLNGTFKSKINFEGALQELAGTGVRALDIDLAGDLYVAFELPFFSLIDDVRKLSPSGALLSPTFKVNTPFAVAADASGNVYAMESQARVLGFTASAAPISGMVVADGFAEPPPLGGVFLIGLGTNICPGSEAPGNLYVSAYRFGQSGHATVRAYGTPPIGCEDPPLKAPEIVEQYATSVGVEEATVGAAINPHFWTDTTYHVQYGTGQCLDSGWSEGCKTHPLPPGSTLTSKATNDPLSTAGVLLTDLEPATTYHYRFVAQSSGSEGEPVIGLGGNPGEAGASTSFRTFNPTAAPNTACANQDRRTGPSAQLPDCRAYEMVTPLDKNDSDIHVLTHPGNLYPLHLRQAAVSGQALTYSALSAFGDPQAAPVSSQYLARRSAGGWGSDGISSPASRTVGGELLDTEFKAFSPDLCQGWLRSAFDPPLAPGAVTGQHNLYRAEYCKTGGYRALTTVEPQIPEPGTYSVLEFQGISDDGSSFAYSAPDNLTFDAPTNTDDRPQLYHWQDGQLRFACLRPNGAPSPEACSAAGRGSRVGGDKRGNYADALSADGRRLYWSEGPASAASPSLINPIRLFVRENPGAEQSAIASGKCTEPEKACTYPVSSPVSPEPAQFWGANEDGSLSLFTIRSGPLAGNLYLFDLERAKAGETATTLLAPKTQGVLGRSDDLARIYFVSGEDLDEGGPAAAGQNNLYLRDSSSDGIEISHVATLASKDLDSNKNAPWLATLSASPNERSSRVSPDGRLAVFISLAALTDYDNRNPANGERGTEVYLYDAEGDDLVCISCNPTGARPTLMRDPFARESQERNWVTGSIPAWEGALYSSRVISEDGRRIFFESFEALVPRDTNGMGDVYQWEAVGKGDCDAADPTYNPENGGCVDLISSGKSNQNSHFVDASASGGDVFFTTASSLVPPDYGLVDIYDARIGGGFSYPEPPKQCEGEACQGPPAPPAAPTPASSVFSGAGNFKQGAPGCRPHTRRAARAARTAKRARRAARRSAAPPVARRLDKRATRASKRARRLAKRVTVCRRQSANPNRRSTR